MSKSLRLILLTLISCLALNACAPVLVGSLDESGLILADRRSTGTIADDRILQTTIFAKVRQAFPIEVDANKPDAVSLPSLKIRVYNHKVLLVGRVANQAQKNRIHTIAKAQKTTQKVYDYLKVAQGVRSVGDNTNDALITGRVRMALLNVQDYSPNNVKVVTYEGIVYVFGLLTPEEQARVSYRISTVPGVRRVITLYDRYAPTDYSAPVDRSSY